MSNTEFWAPHTYLCKFCKSLGTVVIAGSSYCRDLILPNTFIPFLTEITRWGLYSQIARFMGPTWGPPGSCRPQMGPMLAPWTLLSGFPDLHNHSHIKVDMFVSYSLCDGWNHLFYGTYHYVFLRNGCECEIYRLLWFTSYFQKDLTQKQYQ